MSAKKQWYGTTKAAELLNSCTKTLLRQRKDKTLIKGKHWRVKNPEAVRLTYEFNVPAIERFRATVITEVEPAAKAIATQPALLADVEPYDITAAGEAVPVGRSPHHKPFYKSPHRSNVDKP